ncbi:CPBP family intramembrane glutamic endopeptidase [Candidatus Nitrosacidococcus tergens]|uniref:Abortive infection protein n=1 Tax=Candidatus Nitrosacidococcus tergens TaxID=553981 RepID=A0A7G1QAH9_9GAMM|nr:CPBP family intramembrane glutamic endopeptidase [Candidatus Nitrosacidococcus tergens]CAB1276032.1 Abortive infection protein [Candidatus Nitrosacidococcus tergens]
MNRSQAWADIFFTLALVGISAIAVKWLGTFITAHQLFVLLILQGITILSGIKILLVYRNQNWQYIKLQPLRLNHILQAFIVLGSGIGVNILLNVFIALFNMPLLEQHLSQLQTIANQLDNDLSVLELSFMMLFVGIYEEIMARGVLLNRCSIALGSTHKGILLSSLLFGLGHLYQGWIGVVQTGLFGMVLAFFTIRWNTLWPAIFAHGSLNTLSLIALGYLAP